MRKFSVIRAALILFSVILTLSFLILMFTGISELRDSASYSTYNLSEEDYLFTLYQEDYVSLLQMTKRDCILNREPTETIKLCQTVALYYEAASLYKAYIVSEKTEKATLWKERMDEYETSLITSSYQEHIDKISDLLN